MIFMYVKGRAVAKRLKGGGEGRGGVKFDKTNNVKITEKIVHFADKMFLPVAMAPAEAH